MEDNDRKKILDNINDLVKYTKYDILVKKCLEKKFFFPQMIEEIEVCLKKTLIIFIEKENNIF